MMTATKFEGTEKDMVLFPEEKELPQNLQDISDRLDRIESNQVRILELVDALTPHLPKLEALPMFGLPWKRKKSDD